MHQKRVDQQEREPSSSSKAAAWARYHSGRGHGGGGVSNNLCARASTRRSPACRQPSRFRIEARGQMHVLASYPQVRAQLSSLQTSRFSEKESTHGGGGSNSHWDCGSSLYDSVELRSFSNQLGSSLFTSPPNNHIPQEAAPSSSSHLLQSPLQNPGCLSTISMPHFRLVPCRKAAPRATFAVRRSFRKAFQKLAKSVAGLGEAKHLLKHLACHNTGHGNEHEHVHHHYHHHHYFHYKTEDASSRASKEEAKMAAVQLLKQFAAESDGVTADLQA